MEQLPIGTSVVHEDGKGEEKEKEEKKQKREKREHKLARQELGMSTSKPALGIRPGATLLPGHPSVLPPTLSGCWLRSSLALG